MLDVALGNDMSVLRNATIFFYITNEVLSIFENVGRIGIPIPGVLEKAIHVLNEKSEKGEEKYAFRVGSFGYGLSVSPIK